MYVHEDRSQIEWRERVYSSDLALAPVRLKTVLLRPTETYNECRSWVVSRRQVIVYISHG